MSLWTTSHRSIGWLYQQPQLKTWTCCGSGGNRGLREMGLRMEGIPPGQPLIRSRLPYCTPQYKRLQHMPHHAAKSRHRAEHGDHRIAKLELALCLVGSSDRRTRDVRYRITRQPSVMVGKSPKRRNRLANRMVGRQKLAVARNLYIAANKHKENNPAVAKALYLRALKWLSDVDSRVEGRDEFTSLVSKQLTEISAELKGSTSVQDERSLPVAIAAGR